MIRIVTDSAADLTARDLETPGVTVVPMGITFADGTATVDDGSMTKDEFFTRLAEDSKLPRTSQPSPQSFMTIFEDAKENGDQVIAILISSNLSGTYQCAKLAADMANVDNVLFVDSGHVCLSEALLVRLAVQLRDSGKTAGQIAAILEHAKEHLHLVAAIDDLKYLRKGGRLPACRSRCRRDAGHQAPYHHPGRQGRYGRQGPRPARRLRGPVQEDRGDGRHQSRLPGAGRLHRLPP